MSEPNILRTLRMSPHNKTVKEVAKAIALMEFEYIEIEEGKRAVSDDQCDIGSS
ncbi:hypothetical protein [Filimonas effusa]|uniref:hypothetical protein n=1 Tax=Filimonas effusa TaxID=2508721 RepID=UPI0013E96A0F|nr:hypothetical protein [Filimonas effusa]